MTTITTNTPTTSPADQGRTSHVLLSAGQGRLTRRQEALSETEDANRDAHCDARRGPALVAGQPREPPSHHPQCAGAHDTRRTTATLEEPEHGQLGDDHDARVHRKREPQD